MIRSPYDIYCGSETQLNFHLLQRALYRWYKRKDAYYMASATKKAIQKLKELTR